MWQRSWSQIKQNFKVYRRLIGTHTSLAKDHFVNWQSSPIVISKSVCILRFSIVSGQMNPYPESIDPLKKKIVSGLWVPLNVENWIESTGNRWNSSGNISQDSLHYRFSPRFRKWWTKCSVFRYKISSVSQLNVYGAVADMCDELVSWISDCLESTRSPVAEDKSVTMLSVPTELSTTTKPLLTNETVQQGDLLREYERKFANLPDDTQLIRLCSDAGFMKTAARGQYFVTLDEGELANWDGSCRECTSPRDDQLSKVKWWIRETRGSVQYWK